MSIPFQDLRSQYAGIKSEIDAAIKNVLKEAAFVGGRFVTTFEEEYAASLGATHCVGVGNGTDALEIVLECADLPTGSEVVVPALTFIATSEAVSRAGLVPVFADVDPTTYTLDPEDIGRRITDRTRAIIPVHLYGHPAEMDSIRAIADPHELLVVEDAAQAHTALYQGRPVGTLASASCFSFYPGKNLGAFGDAGAITTEDYSLAKRCRMFANHGRAAKYEHEFEGRSSRLDGLQAAILSVKLRHLERWTEHRRHLATLYVNELSGVGDLVLPVEKEGCRHVYHLFVVRTERRNELRSWLTERQIATGIHYPTSLPKLAAYETHRQSQETFRANAITGEILSLPMGDGLTVDQVEQVIEEVRNFFAD